MLQKLQIEDILMNIIPGSILFGGLLYLLDFDISNLESSNYVSSFVFTSLSYVGGELMKTISHLKIFEYPIKIFFKGHMPSEIRLTKNNPIVSNYSLEKNGTKYIGDYETLKLSLSKSKDSILDFNQSEFNSIYALVRNESNIRKSNSIYVFNRTLYVTFFLLGVTGLIINELTVGLLLFVISLVLLRRARGCSRGLVKDVFYSHKCL